MGSSMSARTSELDEAADVVRGFEITMQLDERARV
jgi:hypothetical protein